MANINENAIRDFLAENLDLVEPGLEFLGVEHHLRNPAGSAGYVDIFARGPREELVIIEIKRTRSGSREALHELFKYAALLRHKFLLKEREYRLVFLSVDWEDLRVPFWDCMRSCPYDISAGHIILGDDGLPNAIEAVPSPENIENRKIARHHYLWHFKQQRAAERAVPIVAEHVKRSGIADFILVRSKAAANGKTRPFVYFAQQQKTAGHYLALLQERVSQDEFIDIKESIQGYSLRDDQEAFAADRAWEVGISEAHARLKSSSSEISHPEKAAQFFDEETLQAMVIERFGRFALTPACDEQLVAELVLTDSFEDLDIIATTDSVAQMNELLLAVSKGLRFNNDWRAQTRDLIDYARHHGPAVMRLQIHANENVVRNLAAEYYKASLYTPRYQLVIDFQDRREEFEGFIEWNGVDVDLRGTLESHFGGRRFRYFGLFHFGNHRPMNQDVMSDLGLRYSIRDKSCSEPHRVRVQGDILRRQKANSGLAEFVKAHGEELKEFAELFIETDLGFRNSLISFFHEQTVAVEEYLSAFVRQRAVSARSAYWCDELSDDCEICQRPFEHLKFMAAITTITLGSLNCCGVCFVAQRDQLLGGAQLYIAENNRWRRVLLETAKPS
ncbi:endonuclease NucS domain-containing protein [Agrobacterium fabrum]|uniref:endonuclease NucS domain-containing protein n=1 Tax=Agrobacterium fabrum TaxID=1176649 RepID=UPI003BA132AE